MKIHNFSAGPCILPQSVLKQASEAVLDFNNSGLSLIEISHRSKDFVEVMMQANADLQPLMKDLDNPKKLQLLEASADILLGDKAATPDIENLYYDAQFVDRAGNIQFLADDKYPHRLDVLNNNIQDAFNAIGLIKIHAPIVAADWDYSQF